ncbi:MAG: ATP-dependent helicase, partial [Acidimicrobiia bacterium]|nr:ATP-dependent helicase [Acidimicrobiia bacterium]
YHQVGSSPGPFFGLSQGGFVILDEIHHAGEERTWGDGARVAFDGAGRRLALSGTPFRSDTNSIPFVRYVDDMVVPDVEYGYGEALADGRVVRPVYFPRFGGFMEWTAPDGAALAASFDDTLARTEANQRLRVALSLEGEWLPTVIGHANEQLVRIREAHDDAGGLVIASDQDHARGIAGLLRRRFGVKPVVATSEDPDASERIAAFAQSDDPWIVAVRMVSEGVDIPRLRVGVYATTTTTELFFRQAVGRIVRHIAGQGRQRAYLFMPDDPRLRHFGHTIADARRHCLANNSRQDSAEVDDDERPRDGDGDQMSLFSVLSATATDAATDADAWADAWADGPADDEDVLADHDEPEADGETASVDIDLSAESLVVDLRQLPPPALGRPVGHGGVGFDRNERDRLRRINNDLTKELVDLTGRPHSQVNAELNRNAGIAKVSEATIIQLNRRSRAAEEWLRREHRRRRFTRFV